MHIKDTALALHMALRWYNRPVSVQKAKAYALTDERRQSLNQLLKTGDLELLEYHGQDCIQLSDQGLTRLQELMPKVTAQFTPNRNLRNVSDDVIEYVHWVKDVKYDGHKIITTYIKDPQTEELITDQKQAYTLPARQWRDVKDFDKKLGIKGTHFFLFEYMAKQLVNLHERQWYRL